MNDKEIEKQWNAYNLRKYHACDLQLYPKAQAAQTGTTSQAEDYPVVTQSFTIKLFVHLFFNKELFYNLILLQQLITPALQKKMAPFLGIHRRNCTPRGDQPCSPKREDKPYTPNIQTWMSLAALV